VFVLALFHQKHSYFLQNKPEKPIKQIFTMFFNKIKQPFYALKKN